MDYSITNEQLSNDVFLISEKSVKTYSSGKLLVLDTSVIVKWFFKDGEKSNEKADIILNRYMDNKIGIVIPELSVFELANVLKNKIKRYKGENQDIIDRLYKMGIIFYIDKEILKNAVNYFQVIKIIKKRKSRFLPLKITRAENIRAFFGNKIRIINNFVK